MFGSFTSSTATCWHLPLPGVRQKRRMWLTVSINLLSVPSCARTCHGLHVPPTMPGVLSLKQCSVMLCAHQCLHGQNSPSLRNKLSKTGSFLHNQTLVFQQERLPDFPLLWKPRGHPAATSRVCQTCRPNADSSGQPLLCPCTSGPGAGQTGRLGMQHFSP